MAGVTWKRAPELDSVHAAAAYLRKKGALETYVQGLGRTIWSDRKGAPKLLVVYTGDGGTVPHAYVPE